MDGDFSRVAQLDDQNIGQLLDPKYYDVTAFFDERS